MKPYEVLEKAADLVDQGWTTHVLSKRRPDGGMSYCALGAIGHASANSDNGFMAARPAVKALADHLASTTVQFGYIPYGLREVYGEDEYEYMAVAHRVAHWNNHYGTQATVSDAMRQAAAKLRIEESLAKVLPQLSLPVLEHA